MKFRIDEERCILCFNCQSICPVDAIRGTDTRIQILPELCTGCGICHTACPVQAIEPVRIKNPVYAVSEKGAVSVNQGQVNSIYIPVPGQKEVPKRGALSLLDKLFSLITPSVNRETFNVNQNRWKSRGRQQRKRRRWNP